MRLVDEDFIDAMHSEFYAGCDKQGRQYWDWKNIKWSNEQKLLYTAKLIGHMAKSIRAETSEERLKHLAAVACNANILWHHQKE